MTTCKKLVLDNLFYFFTVYFFQFFSRRGKLLKGLTEEGINCGGCGEKTVRLRPGKGTFVNDVTHLVGIAVL